MPCYVYFQLDFPDGVVETSEEVDPASVVCPDPRGGKAAVALSSTNNLLALFLGSMQAPET